MARDRNRAVHGFDRVELGISRNADLVIDPRTAIAVALASVAVAPAFHFRLDPDCRRVGIDLDLDLGKRLGRVSGLCRLDPDLISAPGFDGNVAVDVRKANAAIRLERIGLFELFSYVLPFGNNCRAGDRRLNRSVRRRLISTKKQTREENGIKPIHNNFPGPIVVDL